MTMTNTLAKYNAACIAIQEAASVDEVLEIRDQAEAMRAYGRQAKNRELESFAQEIRLRAERKLGGLIIQQKETVGLAPAGRPSNQSVVADDQLTKPPTLSEMGISKDLSSRAQKLASVPDSEFEDHLTEHKQRIASENARVVNKLETAGAAAIIKSKKTKPVDVDLVAENERLTGEMAELSEFIKSLQESLKETLADNEMMGRVFDADDKMAAVMAEAKRYRALAENAERTLAAKNGEYVERARAVEQWKRRAEKAEKKLKLLEAA